MTADTASTLDELRRVVRTCPVIDNHAHNLLRPQQLKTSDLLTITTEAGGQALEDTPKSLSHLRAARQLRKLYELPADADWDTLCKKRLELLDKEPNEFISKCLEGTQTILIDDGLGDPSTLESYSWHDKYTLSPCKRIVRIETIAADILSSLHQQDKLPTGIAIADEEACSFAWVTFITAFEQAIAASVGDEEVVGFKSVVCYRTGLDVRVGRDIEVNEDGLRSFRRHFLPECVARNFRVDTKGMNDALVISACKLIAAGHRQTGRAKPLQFHTGLGDNDISLLDSNPGCLQPLIKAFPNVPIVLLHSSYPYTREAGYLATVYKNVYLDIGEVFPMVSRQGQERIVHQALELVPTCKLLWSTDGHHFPETYWLANVQGREVIEKVLCEYVEADDFSVEFAIQAVKDLFFENSNRLYGLGLKMASDTTSLPEWTKEITAVSKTSGALQPGSKGSKEPTVSPNTQYVFIQWIDYMGTMRARCIPISEWTQDLRPGISLGNFGTLQNDSFTPVCLPVGQIYLQPDISTLRPMWREGTVWDAATVIARTVNEADEPHELCPKSGLEKLTRELEATYDFQFLVGFEIEITFCRRFAEGFQPLDTNHAWGTFTDDQYATAFPLMLTAVAALRDIGIRVQQLHSEAGAGQYEFVLPPLPLAKAVDTLVQAKQCIQQVAATNNLRATCHVLPFPGIGTAAHAHISLNSTSLAAEELEKLSMSFMAGILKHLEAICAFTMPEGVSYGRVADDHWTGGTWVAWGTQNRETPIRKVEQQSRWEIRCLDGMANMYLALGAILSAGKLGLEAKMEMEMKDCTDNPSRLSETELQNLGITRKLPTSFDEALAALKRDETLEGALSPNVVKHFVAMKKAEQEMLANMEEKERHVWLMERY